MRTIIIEISGGNIQDIYSTDPELDNTVVFVIDYDNINNGQLELLEEFPIDYITREVANNIINTANRVIEENPERI